jgi:hypothetical protein
VDLICRFIVAKKEESGCEPNCRPKRMTDILGLAEAALVDIQ